MQPPPPAGCTGKAPPGAGGGAGVTLDEAAVAAIAVASPGNQPSAKTSTPTQALKAAAVVACRLPITDDCSYSPRDAHRRARTLTRLQESIKDPPRTAADGEVARRAVPSRGRHRAVDEAKRFRAERPILGSVAAQAVCTCRTPLPPVANDTEVHRE